MNLQYEIDDTAQDQKGTSNDKPNLNHFSGLEQKSQMQNEEMISQQSNGSFDLQVGAKNDKQNEPESNDEMNNSQSEIKFHVPPPKK